jgi:sugar phosphate isomerase/epimerase
MPIRLSCADFSFSRLNFAQCCQLIAWLGIEYVDIGIYAEPGIAHFTVKDVLGDTRMVADLVLAGTQAAGIRVGQIFVNPHHPKFANLAVNHPDLTVRSESAKIFRHAIDLALQVGASSIGGLPGVTFNQLGPVRSFELAVQELTHRAEMAGERGVRFVVEPHIGSLLENPAIVHEFCTVAPAVRLLLDYSHFIFQGYPQDVVD